MRVLSFSVAAPSVACSPSIRWRRCQSLLVDVQRDLHVVVLVTAKGQVLEADRDVLFAEAEEAADADQSRDNLAVAIGHEIVDVAIASF